MTGMGELEKVATPVTSLTAKHLSGNKIGYCVATDWLQRLFFTVPTGVLYDSKPEALLAGSIARRIGS
jgi:hypothetical protein